MGEDCLIRAQLWQTKQNEWVLGIVQHHIISDGWSMGIFCNELSMCYKAYCHEEEPILAPLSIQYVDYALWQRGWLQGEVLEEQLRYWKGALTNSPVETGFPNDYARPKEATYQGGYVEGWLSKEQQTKLNALAREEGATLFMTLLSVLYALLGRYGHEEERDLVIGTPIANRRHRETESLIGSFVNTLALRAHYHSGQSFIELLKQVKEMALLSYAHQDLPFEQLVEHLEIERHTSRHAVFQVMFVLQTNEAVQLDFPGAVVEPTYRGSGHQQAKFDISIQAQETEAGLYVGIEYAKDLFKQETIKRLLEHFSILTDALLQAPRKSISTLNLLTEAEQRQQLITWNETKAEYPEEATLQGLFEQKAEENPDAIAVVFEEEELTYQALNERSNQLAHYLRSQGVERETLVAVSVERSMELIISLLGILKAGGAYVPLDPSYPKARLDYMLGDSQARYLITHAATQEAFGDYQGKRIDWDADSEVISQQSVQNPERMNTKKKWIHFF